MVNRSTADVDPVGRAAEQAVLAQLVASAAPGAALITGEAGVGKTTLARWAARLAAEQGAAVLQSRCYAGSGATPFGPVVEAIGRHLRRLDPAARDAAVTGLPSLGLLFDDLTAGAGPPATDELARTRLLDGIAVLLERLSGGEPLLWLLDDVHLADESTLELLQYLAPDPSVLVLATVRSDELQEIPRARATMAHLRRHGATVVDLDRLDREHIVLLLRTVLDGPVPPTLADLAVERSDGVPLYVVELVRDLADRGALTHDGRVWRLEPDAVAPLGLAADLVADRLSLLDATERHAVELLAVSSGPLLDGELRRLLGSDTDDTLGALARRGLATDDAGVDGTVAWTLAHPLVRDAALAGCTETHRRALHGEMLDVVEVTDTDRCAHHLLGSGRTGSHPDAAKVLLVAGQRALDCGAIHRAHTLLEHAIRCAEDRHDHLTARLSRMWAAETMSRGGDHLAAHHRYSSLFDEVLGAGDLHTASDVLLRWAQAAWRAGRRADIARAQDALLERLNDAPPTPERTEIQTTQLLETLWIQLRDAESVPAEAIERVRSHRAGTDPRLDAGFWLAEQALGFMSFDFGPGTAEQAVALAETPGLHPQIRVRLLNLALDVGVVQLPWSRVAELEALNLGATTAAGMERGWRLTLLRSQLLVAAGRLTEALETEMSYADLRMGHSRIGSTIATLRGLPLLYLGEFAEVQRLVRDAYDTADPDNLYDVSYLATIEALLGVHSNDRDRMAEVVDRILGVHCAGITVWQLAARLECLALLDRNDDLVTAVERCRQLDGGTGQASAWASRATAIARRRHGDPTAANAAFVDAAHRFEALGMPLEAARVTVEAARCAPAGAAPHAHDLTAAVDTLRRSGAAEARMAHGLAPGDEPTADADDDVLTRREREVAELVAEGLTNREVAERLFISVRTVTSHLDHIYTKLGLSSRRELAGVITRSSPA